MTSNSSEFYKLAFQGELEKERKLVNTDEDSLDDVDPILRYA